MNDEQIKQMILGILKIADYDIFKSFRHPEEPEETAPLMQMMVNLVKQSLKFEDDSRRIAAVVKSCLV